MTVIISGQLKDGMGQPITQGMLTLTAQRTSPTVLVHTHATLATNENGFYRMEVEPGGYDVTLTLEGWPPQKVGEIEVFTDSIGGSLNDFLISPTQTDLRPDVIRRFEEMVSSVVESQREVEHMLPQVEHMLHQVE